MAGEGFASLLYRIYSFCSSLVTLLSIIIGTLKVIISSLSI